MTSVNPCLFCPHRPHRNVRKGIVVWRGVCAACFIYLHSRFKDGRIKEEEAIKKGWILPPKPKQPLKVK